ncbi:DUF6412 domain-containing protein [Streptacidiphilus sp. EB103A]|uniref:DUF6412 domain-containing protein n=1 Tax=Streptacidiphilus sp. EB103A TaxID=3156275 RepID=UPI0035199106
MDRATASPLRLLGLLGLAAGTFAGVLLPLNSGGGLHLLATGAFATGVGLLLASALAITVLGHARSVGPTPHTVRSTAVRRRAWRTAYLPQRDPDARGRRRPRAPGTAPAAA